MGASNGQGGFTLDASGGLHWFSIGTQRAAPPLVGEPSGLGFDNARGVTILPSGTGGYVVDKTGVWYFFTIGPTGHNGPTVSGGPT